MEKARPELIAVVLLVAVSGCPSGTGGNIAISGNITATDGEFHLNGTVAHTGYTRPTHQNITMYLYTGDGSVIASKSVGTLEETDELAVQMHTDRVPKYIIINSPDFWTHDDISVKYYEFVKDSLAPDGIYSSRNVGSKDEFPVPVPPDTQTPE